jgi:hypothetical protein
MQKLLSYETHAWYSRIYKKLKPDEVKAMIAFLKAHDHLETGPFEMAVQRMYLDKPNKPKHWVEINELLIAISAL